MDDDFDVPIWSSSPAASASSSNAGTMDISPQNLSLKSTQSPEKCGDDDRQSLEYEAQEEVGAVVDEYCKECTTSEVSSQNNVVVSLGKNGAEGRIDIKKGGRSPCMVCGRKG